MKKKPFILLSMVLLGFAFAKMEYAHWIRPAHFPEPVYDFSKNPITAAKVELGRMLFFDPRLSADNTISCASCHSPYNAFAHTDHDLSHGIDDQIGTRNAPALFNLAWQPIFMWDGAVNHLDVQALAPISHPKEMGEDIAHVVQKLAADLQYQAHFESAFGENAITGENVLKALAQFQLTLVSAESKYDSLQRGQAKFDSKEANGYRLFQKNCNSCHREPLFSTYKFANNGLPIDTTLNDLGRMTISQKEADRQQFKIPSLRNLSYTYPYMHDGRFNKLNEVLNHYTKGIEQTANLSEELRQPITLSENDKVDLIAFLLTLNDRNFVFDAKHQFPKESFVPSASFDK